MGLLQIFIAFIVYGIRVPCQNRDRQKRERQNRENPDPARHRRPWGV